VVISGFDPRLYLAEELLWDEKEFCEALSSANELYGQPLIRLGGCLTAFQQDLIFGTLQDLQKEAAQRCLEVRENYIYILFSHPSTKNSLIFKN